MKKISLNLAIIGVILTSIGIILLSTGVSAKSKYDKLPTKNIYVDEKTCNEYIVIYYASTLVITPRYGTYSNTNYILQNKDCLKKKERR